jgi:hypothetical protein
MSAAEGGPATSSQDCLSSFGWEQFRNCGSTYSVNRNAAPLNPGVRPWSRF